MRTECACDWQVICNELFQGCSIISIAAIIIESEGFWMCMRALVNFFFFFVDLNINRKFTGCKSDLNYTTFYHNITQLISEEQLLYAVVTLVYKLFWFCLVFFYFTAGFPHCKKINAYFRILLIKSHFLLRQSLHRSEQIYLESWLNKAVLLIQHVIVSG